MQMFDIVIISITLLLAIKGFFNGFIKEIAGLIGIVGGIFFASHYHREVGNYINDNLFHISNSSAIDLVGFITIFIGFWLFVIFLGFLFNKILHLSALGIFDRILGFIFSGAKFFVIVSVIIVMLSQIKVVKEKLDQYTKNSIVYEYMLEVGSKIINFSSEDIKNFTKNVKIPLNN